MIKKYLLSLFLLVFCLSLSAQGKKYIVHTIAFYNTENLYDTINDPKVNDEEFLPEGKEIWTGEKYDTKLSNIAKVISEIGTDENPNCPTIIGLCEIENRRVLTDLTNHDLLVGKGYGIVHFDSPDARGIDVALLYQKKHFKPTSYKSIPLIINRNANDTITDYAERVLTRNPLLVTGVLDGEEMHFIVNHWPSRSGGEKKSKPYREAAAALNRKIVDSLYAINSNAKIIIMGDFNDGPYNSSIKKVIGTKGKREDVKAGELFNPMGTMSEEGIGSVAYKDAWDIFDQIIISEPLLKRDFSSLRFWKASVFDKSYLRQQTGQYKGYPLRNWNGEVGYSDHFPVYIYLIKQP